VKRVKTIRRESSRREDGVLKIQTKPSRLTLEVVETICAYVYMGAPYNIAAEAAGIPAGTEAGWRQKGMMYIEEIEETGAPTNPKHAECAAYAKAAVTARANWQMRLLRRSFQDSFRSTWIRDLALLERRDSINWQLREDKLERGDQEGSPDEEFL
jgi:hypothetical protein